MWTKGKQRKRTLLYLELRDPRDEPEKKEWMRQGPAGHIFIALDMNVFAEDDVEFCRRIGERSEKPRPLVVGFFTEWSRSVVLKNTKKLAGCDLEHISICLDPTKRQRKMEEELT